MSVSVSEAGSGSGQKDGADGSGTQLMETWLILEYCGMGALDAYMLDKKFQSDVVREGGCSCFQKELDGAIKILLLTEESRSTLGICLAPMHPCLTAVFCPCSRHT